MVTLFFPKIKSAPQKVFFKLIGGILFWIVAISIFATFFKTINILVLFVGIFLWKKEGVLFLEIQPQRLLPSVLEVKYLFLCLIVLSLFIGVQFFRNDYFNPDYIYFSNPDFSFYLTMAEYLYSTGVERLTSWYELFEMSKVDGVEPYHYGDIWLTSVFLQWCQIVPLKMFLYVLIPTLSTVSFTGLHTLYNIHSGKTGNRLNILICFFMLFSIGGIPFIREAYGFSILPLTSPKTFLFFNLCILGFICLLKNKHQIFLTILCVIPIFHILYAPLIFSALFLWSGFFYFFKKEKWAIDGLLFPSLMTLGIFIFYFLFGRYNTYYDVTSNLELMGYMKMFMITSLRDVLARAVFFYLPIIILMSWVWKNRSQLSDLQKQIFSFSGALLSVTIFFRGLLNYNHESLQISQIIFNPILTILLLFIFTILVKNNFFINKYRRWIYVLIITHLISSTYILLNKYTQREHVISHDFLNRMEIELKERSPLGVFISSSEEMDFHSVSPHLCHFAEPLKLIGNNKWVNSISIPEDLENFPFPERISSIADAPFFKFIQDQKKRGIYISYSNAQKEFIEKNNIDFVLIEEGVILSKELKSIIEKIITDESSGIRLGIFKNEN